MISELMEFIWSEITRDLLRFRGSRDPLHIFFFGAASLISRVQNSTTAGTKDMAMHGVISDPGSHHMQDECKLKKIFYLPRSDSVFKTNCTIVF